MYLKGKSAYSWIRRRNEQEQRAAHGAAIEAVTRMCNRLFGRKEREPVEVIQSRFEVPIELTDPTWQNIREVVPLFCREAHAYRD